MSNNIKTAIFISFVFILNTFSQVQKEFKSRFSIAELESAPVKLIPYPQKVEWGTKSLEVGAFTLEVNPELNKNKSFAENELES